MGLGGWGGGMGLGLGRLGWGMGGGGWGMGGWENEGFNVGFSVNSIENLLNSSLLVIC